MCALVLRTRRPDATDTRHRGKPTRRYVDGRGQHLNNATRVDIFLEATLQRVVFSFFFSPNSVNRAML